MLISVEGWSGPSLAFRKRQRLLAELKGFGMPARPYRRLLARLPMLRSVSGWSGPSLAL